MTYNYQDLTKEEKQEIFEDRVHNFTLDHISEDIFRKEMADLGHSAVEIEELVSFYRPEPPENAGEEDV